MKFSIKDFFSKCDQIRVDLVTITEEILIEKLYFLCSVFCQMFFIEWLKFKVINNFCLIFLDLNLMHLILREFRNLQGSVCMKLNIFQAIIPFLYLLKSLKAISFLTFSGGLGVEQ